MRQSQVTQNIDYNLRRKQRASEAQQAQTSTANMDITGRYNLDTQEGQIAMAREQILRNRRQFEEARAQANLPLNRSQVGAFTPRQQRIERIANKMRYLKDLEAQRLGFESDAARTEKQIADYLDAQQKYEEAKALQKAQERKADKWATVKKEQYKKDLKSYDLRKKELDAKLYDNLSQEDLKQIIDSINKSKATIPQELADKLNEQVNKYNQEYYDWAATQKSQIDIPKDLNKTLPFLNNGRGANSSSSNILAMGMGISSKSTRPNTGFNNLSVSNNIRPSNSLLSSNRLFNLAYPTFNLGFTLSEINKVSKQGYELLGKATPEIKFIVPFWMSKSRKNQEVKVTDVLENLNKYRENRPTLTNVYKKADELNKLEKGKVNQAGEWIGSEESYNNYLRRFAEYDNLKKRYEAQSTKDKYIEGAKSIGLSVLSKYPKTYGQAAVLGASAYGGAKGIQYGIKGGAYVASQYPKLAKVGEVGLGIADILILRKAIKDLPNPTIPEETKLFNVGFGALSGYNLVSQATKIPKLFAKGTGRSSSLTAESMAEPYLRKRATIILEDAEGKILYHVDKNTGLAILPGGAIESGESALKAAQRELFEETGLRLRLSKFDKVVTERETNYIYKAKVDNLSNLIPKLVAQAKEVTGFRAINPGTYTGKTQLNVFGSKGIRAEDLYIGSRNSAIKEIEDKISKLNEQQRAILLNKARTELVKVYGNQALMLSKTDMLKEYLLLKKGMQYQKLYINPVAEIFMRKGKPAFLKKRVKKASIREPSSWVDFIAGRKPGQFKRFQKEAPIVVGFGSRYDVPFKSLKKYGKNLNTYLHGSPGEIKTKDDIYAELLNGGKNYNPKVDETFKVLKSKGKRGEQVLYFQPATTPEGREAYIGASYLGLLTKAPKNVEEVTIGFTKSRPVIYRTKATAGKELIFTKKAKRGTEFEVGATPGTVFKITGRPQSINLGGKRVKIQDIKLVKASKNGLNEEKIRQGLSNIERMNKIDKIRFINRIKRETGRDYSYYLKRGIVVNPINAFNIIVTPSKFKKNLAMKTSDKVNNISEKIASSSEKLNRLITGASKVRYSEKPGKYKMAGYKQSGKAPSYLVPNYKVPQKPVPPYKPSKYNKPEKPRYVNPNYYLYPVPPYKVSGAGRLTARLLAGGKIEKKRRITKQTKKPTRYQTLPTVFELLTFGGAKSRRPKVKITGSEVFRFN